MERKKKINLAVTPVTLKSESTALVGNQRCCSFPTAPGEDLTHGVSSHLTSSHPFSLALERQPVTSLPTSLK